MKSLWQAALAVCGLAALGAFVLWSLYKQWLTLPIFSQVSPEQTFSLMRLFLILTFVAFVVCVAAYLVSKRQEDPSPNKDHVFDLHKAWEGVNEIDCDKLIGPDVTNAARALTITATTWLNGLVDRQTIISSHFDDYELLVSAMEKCDKIVPGFEKRGVKCKDFLSGEIIAVYGQMKKYKGASK